MSDNSLDPKSSVTPEQLKEAARTIRALYARYNISLHSNSAVGKIVCGAENIPYRGGQYLETPARNVFDSFWVIDLCGMLKVIEDHPKAEEYLRMITKDSLSSYSTGPSRAKDLLWELDVCSKIRSVGLSAELKEPPDIVWTQDDKVTGISCKKIYGDNRVQAAISKGVEQLGRAGPYGILALNIDEYVPRDKTLIVRDAAHTADLPNKIIREFSSRHHRHIQKYYDSARLSGVMIAITCRTRVDNGSKPPSFFMNVLWDARTSPSLDWEHQRRLFRLARWMQRVAPERA